MGFYLSNKTKQNKTNIEGLSNRPKHGIHGANRFAPFPFLAQALGYIPKASPHSPFPYLAPDFYLRLNSKVQLLKHHGPAIKIHCWTTLTNLSNQDLLIYRNRLPPFSLKPLLQKHLLSASADPEATLQLAPEVYKSSL